MAASGPKPNLTSAQLVKAFAHPIRVQTMAILNEQVASPKEVATATGEPVKLVAYHVRVLKKLGLVELVRVAEAANGRVTEHFYKATRRPMIDLEAWHRLSNHEKHGAKMTIMGLISGDVALAMQKGTFMDPDDGHLSRVAPTVDRQGWDESTAILDEAVIQLLAVQEESAERIANGARAVMKSEIAIIQFRLPDGRAK